MKTNFNAEITNRLLYLEKTLPLEKFIPSALMVFLLCLFILSVITYSNIGEYRKELEVINSTNSVLKQIDNVNLHTIELSIARRNFIIINPEEKYLREMDSLTNVCRREIFELKKMMNENIKQFDLLQKADSLSEENIKIAKISTAYFMDEMDSLKYQREATKTIQSNLDQIRSICENLKNSEFRTLNTRTAAALRTNKVIQNFIIGMGIFSFTIIGLAIYVSTRLIRNKNQAQRMLIESYDELENKVEKRTAELQQSKENLEQEIIVRQKTEKNFT
jgi:CHASE3 domain sensor protein